MKNGKIALDLDGVTWNVHEILLDIYNKKYHTHYTNKDITFWDFLPEDRFWECYKEMATQMEDFKPASLYLSLYIKFIHCFYTITFLTHGIYTIKKIEEKLNTWDVHKGRDYENIIIMNYQDSKVHTNFDFYIDDNPNMIIDIQQYPKKTLLLFTQPWNENIDVSIYDNVIRVNTWQDVFFYFFGLGGKVYEKM